MKIGYARVSTVERHLDLQLRALKEVGAERVFIDKGISAGAVIKPGWSEAFSVLRPGDELIVCRLNRICHSVRDVINELDRLRHRGADFRSIYDKIETNTACGQKFFHIIGELVRFERDVQDSRSAERIAVDRSAGGAKTIKDEQWQEIWHLMSAEQPMTLVQAARLLGVSREVIQVQWQHEQEAARGGSDRT